MRPSLAHRLLVALIVVCAPATAQVAPQVIDVPTRGGVTERFVYLAPESAKAAVILFPGGNGGLQIQPDGNFKALGGNFLVRMRQQFVDNGLAVAIVDAPSDRQAPPFLDGFRQTPDHVADVKAVIAWLRQKANVPVWLIGTSRGTQSAAFIATQLPRSNGGPDGLVLTSSILIDKKGRPVPMMPLQNVAIPVLVVHHEQDSCALCPYAEVPNLMNMLRATPKKELITITGGESRGDPCEAFAHHGYNGQEAEVVAKIAAWIKAN
jgi:pimeloyl-ACP methyl ester carboxylesterase